MSSLYQQLCEYSHLHEAFMRAKKGRSNKCCVKDFEKDLHKNLRELQIELQFMYYTPKPHTSFILKDPKTRKIHVSDFRDRIIHHALCMLLEPIFEKNFIHDSYSNRKGKGTLNAIKRFEKFKDKVSKNNTRHIYVLKSDIYHYFEQVNKNILLTILEKKVKDKKILILIQRILDNYNSKENIGMPLGNLTSQFFANIYLNELDQFIKHILKEKYYIRYVDDFVILHHSKKHLIQIEEKINHFLKEQLILELHPQKTQIKILSQGIDFLGMRIFQKHKLLRKRIRRQFNTKFEKYITQHNSNLISNDKMYDFLIGFCAHAKNANTYKFRREIKNKYVNIFSDPSQKEINSYLRYFH